MKVRSKVGNSEWVISITNIVFYTKTSLLFPLLIPIPMASPPEAVVNAMGLTELNPELSPDETLVECVSQPCND